MKKLLFILAAVAMLLSCSSEKETEVRTEDNSLVTISFGGVDISSEPLTRAVLSGNTYLGIQIDTFRTTPYGDTTYVRVAEGVYDYVGDLDITLKKGKTYLIRAAIVTDSKQKLYCEDGQVYAPLAYRGGHANVTNQWQTGSYNVEVQETCYFDTYDPAGRIVNQYYPSLNYYVGSTLTQGGNVTLNMQRRNFGIYFVIAPPSEGSLTVSSNYKEPRFSYTLTPQSEPIKEVVMFALPIDKESAPLNLSVLWTDATGVVHDLSPAVRDMKIRTLTTISIDVSNRTSYDPNANNEEGQETRISMTYSGAFEYGETITVE